VATKKSAEKKAAAPVKVTSSPTDAAESKETEMLELKEGKQYHTYLRQYFLPLVEQKVHLKKPRT